MSQPTSMRVQPVVLGDGERMPVLVDEVGMPLFFPTLFITSRVRNSSKQANTVLAYEDAIKRLYEWAASKQLDLERRLFDQQFLLDHEIESLVRSVGRKRSSRIRQSASTYLPLSKVVPKRLAERQISNASKYRHLMYISSFLGWLARRLIERRNRHIDLQTEFAIKAMISAIDIRRPRKGRCRMLALTRGLDHDEEERLLQAVAVTNEAGDDDQSCRDRIVVRLLHGLGMRAGELLALKVGDFNFRTNEVIVARRPDDSDDPRHIQPTAKTCDRRLPISADVAKLVHDYVTKHRRNASRAKRHEFLIVVHRRGPWEGAPLSISGLRKVFARLKSASKMERLTPHMLRHTNNDRFSELMDAEGVPEAEEDKLRSYAMGWKEGSGSAAVYTRRHTQRKAFDAAKKLQEGLYDKSKEKADRSTRRTKS